MISSLRHYLRKSIFQHGKRFESQCQARSNAALLQSNDAQSEERLFENFIKLEQIESNIFRSSHLLRGRETRSSVYGGQLVAHGLAAASMCIEGESYPHSTHCYFVAPTTVNAPVVYTVENLRDGREFSTRAIKGIQNGQTVFSAHVSFQKLELESIQHHVPQPKGIASTDPEQLKTVQQLAREELELDDKRPYNKQMDPTLRCVITDKELELPPTFGHMFDCRPVDQNLFKFIKGKKPEYLLWIKAKRNYGFDYATQRILAAYISDVNLVECSLFPHIATGFVPSQAFTLDHALWYHKPKLHLEEWMLYEVVSPVAAGSRLFSRGRLWTKEGELAMTACQEGLVRTLHNF